VSNWGQKGFATQATSEEKIVRRTVESYLHGLKFNDIDSFKRAIHPEAKLFFVRKNDELGRYGKGRLGEGR
jgi:Putative lumazine-binding